MITSRNPLTRLTVYNALHVDRSGASCPFSGYTMLFADNLCAGYRRISRFPGLDPASGLTRVGGNRSVYWDLLDKFRAHYANRAKEIQGLLAQDELDRASQLIHGLKGVAGNLGACPTCFVLLNSWKPPLQRGTAPIFSIGRKACAGPGNAALLHYSLARTPEICF